MNGRESHLRRDIRDYPEGRGPSIARRAGRLALFLCLVSGLLAAEHHALGERDAFRLAGGWSPVPSGATLRKMSFGYERVMSDVMWLRGLQYYGKQRLENAPMPKFGEYMDAVVYLDPHFIAPYIFGAVVLIQDLGEPEAGIDLLLRGMAVNPKRWELPFELAFLLMVNRGEPRRAGKYFELAADLEGCPKMARRFAAWAYAEGGKREAARAVCEEIMRTSEDPAMKAFAQDALANLRIEEDLEVLRAAITAFQAHANHWPTSLKVLVSSGDLLGIPAEPRGGYYAYRCETGEVGSSTGIERDVNRHLKELEDAIAHHRAREGAYPSTLEDLVLAGFVGEVRTIFGFGFAYDPASGKVWAVDQYRT